MSVISKHFEEIIKHKSCHDIIHPWTPNCYSAIWSYCKRFLFTPPKLLLPICLASTIFTAKDANGVVLGIKNFFREWYHSFTVSVLIMSLSCVLYQINKKICFSTVAMIQTFLTVYFCSSSLTSPLRQLHAHAFFTIALEGFIKGSENNFIIHLRNTTATKTFVFMVCSSVILYQLKRSRNSLFWYLKPSKSNHKNEQIAQNTPNKSVLMDKLITTGRHVCDHKNTCDMHIFKGILEYAKYGFGLELLKRIISSFHLLQRGPKMFLKNIISETNYNFVTFLIVYGGVYLFINCLINRYFKKETAKNCSIAGFICGAAYYIAPNYYFLTSAITTMIQLLWQDYKKQQKNNLKVIKLIDKVQFDYLVYAFSTGMLLHFRIVSPEVIPLFGAKITDILSDSATKEIHERLFTLAKQI